MNMKLEFVIGDCGENGYCPVVCPFLRKVHRFKGDRRCACYIYCPDRELFTESTNVAGDWEDVIGAWGKAERRHPECVRQAKPVDVTGEGSDE